MAEEKWLAPLSTTERNNIGLIQVRQSNINSETWLVPITQKSLPLDFFEEGITQVFFCTKFGKNPVEQRATIIDAKKGHISYTMNEHDTQKTGLRLAYFKFEDDKGNYRGSTQTFTYHVISSIESSCSDSGTYVVRLEELFNMYEVFYNSMKQEALDYHAEQKTIWEKFFNDYREIIESIDPGGILLKEIIEAKGMYPTLNDRLNNIFNYIGLKNNFTQSINENTLIEFDYYLNSIDQREDTMRIIHAPDLHYQKAMKNEYKEATNRDLNRLNILALLNKKVDAASFNGDIVHDNESMNLTRKRLKQVTSIARLVLSDVDLYFTIGNHDTHEVYMHGDSKAPRFKNNVISLNEVEKILDAKNNNFGENRRTDNSTYAFKDYPSKKVRVIQLSGFENPEIYNDDLSLKYPRTYNTVFDNNQIQWLAHEALKNVPDDFGVIVFNHCPLYGFFGNSSYKDYTNVNHDLVKGVLRAFTKGTNFVGTGKNTDYNCEVNVDYTIQGRRKLIGIVSGHEHRDAHDFESDDDLKSILRTCSLASGSPSRKLDTKTEFAIDVIEINMNELTCKFNRFGAGQTLEFEV